MMPQIHGTLIEDAPFAASVVASGIKSAVGIAVGSGVLYWVRTLGECVFKKEAMGEGDVILIGCIGSFCGWQGAIFAIFGGSIIGALTMIPIVATSSDSFRKNPRRAKNSPTDRKPTRSQFRSARGLRAAGFSISCF